MKDFHHMLSSQFFWPKIVFLTILISANASFIQRRVEQLKEPGYYCKGRRYSFSDVENARVTACNAFTSTRNDARRPRVYINSANNENLIFEWSIPAARDRKNGKRINNSEWIIFNINCELKDVVYINRKTKKYESCEKIPEIFTSMASGKKQIPEKPFVQCGSLSWEIEDIQQSAICRLYTPQLKVIGMKDTSNQIDGPWKKIVLGKKTTIHNRPHNVTYHIILNNKNEVRGAIVRHHISQKLTVFPYFIKDKINRLTVSTTWEKRTIDLTCSFDTKFLLVPENQRLNPLNPHKRKTLA